MPAAKGNVGFVVRAEAPVAFGAHEACLFLFGYLACLLCYLYCFCFVLCPLLWMLSGLFCLLLTWRRVGSSLFEYGLVVVVLMGFAMCWVVLSLLGVFALVVVHTRWLRAVVMEAFVPQHHFFRSGGYPGRLWLLFSVFVWVLRTRFCLGSVVALSQLHVDLCCSVSVLTDLICLLV